MGSLDLNNFEHHISVTPVIHDRSHWGIFRITGEDRLRYLHNQSTNKIQPLTPGQGCETVFVTGTARTIDLATVYVLESEVLLIISPERKNQLFQWLDQYIFPMDKVKIEDVSTKYDLWELYTEQNLISNPDLNLSAFHSHQSIRLNSVETLIAKGTSLGFNGYTLLVDKEDKGGGIKTYFDGLNPGELNPTQWEQLRIKQGRPYPEHEITDAYNPLEAGLGHTISFDKGCYIGQETIARINTYDALKQKLWSFELTHPVSDRAPITVEGNKAGQITSITKIGDRWFGLGYVKTKLAQAGAKVNIEDTTATLLTPPYSSPWDLVPR
jgi:folate-binding protein YgfZ